MSVIVNDYLEVVSTDAASNTARIKYTVICSTSGESYNNYTQYGDFWVDGGYHSSEYTLPRNSDTTVFEDTITVSNASGRTVSASYSFPTTPAGGTKTGSSSITIPEIPRYPTANHSLNSKTLTSIKMNWWSDSIIDYLWYSTNCGSTWNGVDVSDGTSGTYTINNLQPNTTYNIKTRLRRRDSQFTKDTGNLSVTTYDIARITSAPNSNHGDNITVNYSNPSGSSIQVGIYKTDGVTPIAAYRACSGSNYTFNFTDTELDNLYKQYGNSNAITVRAYIKTANSYIAYRDFIITLTGNQKTIKIKDENTWLRGKIWIKNNNVWKRAVVWKKIDGTWHKSI